MTILDIPALEDPRLDVYARIPERQLLTINEPAPGLFIAESFKVLERALAAGYEPISLLVEKSRLHELTETGLAAYFDSPEVPIYCAAEEVLDRLTGYHLTGGCLCAMKRKAPESPEPFLEKYHRIVILENVMNPTNVGAIFRSAAALGMEAVLLTRSCADPLYRRAIRVGMGTVFQIPWTIIDSAKEISWPGDGIKMLHNHGFKLASMALRKESVDISDPVLKSEDKLAVLMGSEGEGLLDETIDKSDYVIKIPMAHGVDSLNVAAASALAFWELH